MSRCIPPFNRFALLLVVAAIATPSAILLAVEPLRPNQLLLVYNRDDAASRQLAEYYAKRRAVPEDRLLGVRANSRREEISREHFDRYIRGPIRACLQEREFGREVRCIVLFYGLPIRVAAKKETAAERKLAEQWQEELRQGAAKLSQATAAVQAVASQPAPQSLPAGTGEVDLGRMSTQYEQARNRAGQRIEQMRKSGRGQQEFTQLMSLIQSVEGSYSIVARAQAASNLAAENAAQIQKAMEKFRADEARINELRDRRFTDPAREEARRLILQNHGLMGYLKSLVYDIGLTRTKETSASVDSELTLAWWDDYLLYRWVPNLLSWHVRANPGLLVNVTLNQRQTPVLMTCRIDGPSADVARRIIDDSIAAEQTGLRGNVCLDARGLHDDKKGFGEYDENLRELSTLLSRQTKLDVNLDDQAAVFGPGDCPNTMLYCGWYSLRQFVDAFEFARGAVGYHIASFEAISIKAPLEKGWVKGLLEDGVVATVGSVAEPYLQSFPKPTRFFGLLLTGRFTLAECYAYTADFNSWRMLLIGDPLYRPFAASPQLPLEQVYAPERIPPEFRADATSRPG